MCPAMVEAVDCNWPEIWADLLCLPEHSEELISVIQEPLIVLRDSGMTLVFSPNQRCAGVLELK